MEIFFCLVVLRTQTCAHTKPNPNPHSHAWQKDPVLQQEYKRYHANVWPEMQAALKRSGWHNYSLFLHPDGSLFGVFESESNLQQCLAAMEKEEVNAKWQAEMKKFVRSGGV